MSMDTYKLDQNEADEWLRLQADAKAYNLCLTVLGFHSNKYLSETNWSAL
jgi:hypothetical protein